jgi:hypothetical protein
MAREPNEAEYEALSNQSLRRPLTAAERALADALDAILGRGEHDFAMVASSLQGTGVARPSGRAGPWTAEVLDEELKRINASLDQAYTKQE